MERGRDVAGVIEQVGGRERTSLRRAGMRLAVEAKGCTQAREARLCPVYKLLHIDQLCRTMLSLQADGRLLASCAVLCCYCGVQYARFVKPAFDDFVLPTKKYADIIIPRGGDNHVAVDLIVQVSSAALELPLYPGTATVFWNCHCTM